MTELQGKKRRQPSSCPENWLPAAQVVQLELTCRQEKYANAPSALPDSSTTEWSPTTRRAGMRTSGSPPRAGKGVQRCQAGEPGVSLRDWRQ